MRRSIILGIGLSLLLPVNAYAGEWKQDANGWWWQNDDGTYPTDSWQWLDGNRDGVSECYYFGSDGYMLTNTQIDGYQVDANGAWVVGGTIQTIQDKGQEYDEISDIMMMHTNMGTYLDIPDAIQNKIYSLNSNWNVSNVVFECIQVGDWVYSVVSDRGNLYSNDLYIIRVKPDGSAADILQKVPLSYYCNIYPELYSTLGKVCIRLSLAQKNMSVSEYIDAYYQYDIINNTISQTTKEENDKLRIVGAYNNKNNLYYAYDKDTNTLYGRNIYNEIVEEKKIEVDISDFHQEGVNWYTLNITEADGDCITFQATVTIGGLGYSGWMGQYTVYIQVDKNTGEILNIVR